MRETKNWQALDSFSYSVSSEMYHRAYHLTLLDPGFPFVSSVKQRIWTRK